MMAPRARECLGDTAEGPLLLALERLEAEVQELRVLISAPVRCEHTLEETGRLRDGVERFACALISAYMDTMLNGPDDEAPNGGAIRKMLTALANGLRRL